MRRPIVAAATPWDRFPASASRRNSVVLQGEGEAVEGAGEAWEGAGEGVGDGAHKERTPPANASVSITRFGVCTA